VVTQSPQITLDGQPTSATFKDVDCCGDGGIG
jgi:hypothetical protein